MEVKQHMELKVARRNFALVLTAVIMATNLVILIIPSADGQIFAGHIIRSSTAAAAVAFSLLVVYRQKVDGLFGRAFAALAIGMVLWFIAETLWGYLELVVKIDASGVTIADAFWLAGYGPLGYHLISMSRFFGRRIGKYKLIAVSAAAAVFCTFYVQGLLNLSSPGQDSLLSTAVNIAYPVLDTILVVPAVLMVLNAGKGQLTAVPWIFISWILFVVADSLWGYTFVVNLAGQVSTWNLFYNAAYLCMAAGLFWHNKFFINVGVPKTPPNNENRNEARTS